MEKLRPLLERHPGKLHILLSDSPSIPENRRESLIREGLAATFERFPARHPRILRTQIQILNPTQKKIDHFPEELLPFREHFAEQGIDCDYDPETSGICVPVLLRVTWCVVKFSTDPARGAVIV